MTLISELKVAMLIGQGVSQETVSVMRDFLERQGVQADMLSTHRFEVQATGKQGWGTRIKVDHLITDASAESYDAILVPDGEKHADELRDEPCAIDFIHTGYAAGKTVAAIGHGVRFLIESGIAAGRTIAAQKTFQTIQKDSQIQWTADALASDNGLITCIGEECLTEFKQELLEQLRTGIQQRSETII